MWFLFRIRIKNIHTFLKILILCTLEILKYLAWIPAPNSGVGYKIN